MDQKQYKQVCSSSGPRIHDDLSISEMAIAISEGDSRVIAICLELLKETPRIDPQNPLRGLGHIKALDRIGLYGTSVWVLYADICKKDIYRVIVLLRAVDLGFITEYDLKRWTQETKYFLVQAPILTEDWFEEIEGQVMYELLEFGGDRKIKLHPQTER